MEHGRYAAPMFHGNVKPPEIRFRLVSEHGGISLARYCYLNRYTPKYGHVSAYQQSKVSRALKPVLNALALSFYSTLVNVEFLNFPEALELQVQYKANVRGAMCISKRHL